MIKLMNLRQKWIIYKKKKKEDLLTKLQNIKHHKRLIIHNKKNIKDKNNYINKF